MSLGGGAMSQATSANIACDVARGPGDIARGGGVSGRAMLRCRAMCGGVASDVGESRATSLGQRAMSLRSLELGSDLATSLGPRATSLATSLVGAGRAIIRKSTIPPSPLWASPTRGATWRQRSGGQRSRSAASTSGTMLRHRSGPERHRSAMLACDVTMSCDVARPSQRCSPEPEAVERHRSGPERHRNIAPARGGRAKERHRTPAERHRNVAKA